MKNFKRAGIFECRVNHRFCGRALFFKQFRIFFQQILKILPNYSNSREKTMKFDTPHLVLNIYDDLALKDLTYLERIPNAFSVWRLLS